MAESNVFIRMSDGVSLAATLYLPETEGPWPALLEAYPYRKDDLSVWPELHRRQRDEGNYAVCRLDLRGTGTSEGVALDEYLPRETEDLCEVIDWLSAQDWCTGSVGMFGTSYAGFNSIQTAMRQPPALKAIIPMYATDDRYTDDIHFGGGVRKAIEFGYPLSMVSMNALPPVPSLAGPEWRARWMRRIEELEPWYGSIEEQNDGPFWRVGSLRPDYDLVSVPTMIVAGWADVYRNAALRMMEHLRVPKRLVMGPWCHMLPNVSIPGPRIDIVPEMLRWWDRWLRGIDNGVDRDPPLAFFIQRPTPPEPDLREMRGAWRFESEWPVERSRMQEFPLGNSHASGQVDDKREFRLLVRGDVGTTAHIRGSYPPPYGLPLDQRPDEIHSLVFDWPVDEELEILGNPQLALSLRSTNPVAFVSAKLCDVFPDGTSRLVSPGLLNLTHRNSDTAPEPLGAGATYEVSVELDATSWVFEKGHQVRLAIAGSDWPNAWPPPSVSELTVLMDGTTLTLPVVPKATSSTDPPRFVEISVELDAREEEPDASWKIERDVYARTTRVLVHQVSTTELDNSFEATRTESVEAGVEVMNPGVAWVRSFCESEVVWPEVTARTKALLHLRSDPTTYDFDLTLHVYEDDELIASRRWSRTVPRNLQ